MAINPNDASNLGAILVKNKKITESQLREALDVQERSKVDARLKGNNSTDIQKISDILIHRKYITSRDLAEALSEQYKLPIFTKTSLSPQEIDVTCVKKLRDNVAKEIGAIVLRRSSGNKFFILAIDPGDLRTKVKLKTFLQTDLNNFEFNIVSQDDFNTLFNRIYKFDMSVSEIAKEKAEERKRNLNPGMELNDGGAIASILDTLLSTAIQENVSDVHIESTDNNVVIRYRIDTIPIIKQTFPKDIETMLITRFLIECNLPLDKRNVPLDGRFERSFAGKRYDFRVNILPVYLPDRQSSKIAIRILNRDKLASDIKKIGFTDRTFEVYDRMIHEPHGLILVVGPMGSGKTTTLYSSIAYLDPTKKIIVTLEDPPEFSIQHVNQCKITPEVGFTYESGLKAILRQDADIILVGEIREQTVGKLAIQSAEIGRLVFSTLHVDNAVSSVLRLKNLGIEPFFVSSVLVGVVSQRLVRKICPYCSETYHPKEHDIKAAEALLEKDLSRVEFKKGKGCQRCNNTGYSGLVPTYEILNFKELTKLKEAVASGELSTEKLQAIAIEGGYKPMIYDGFEKVVMGMTTFDEIYRIVVDANQRKLIESKINK